MSKSDEKKPVLQFATAPSEEEILKHDVIDKIIRDAQANLNQLYGREDIKFFDNLKEQLHKAVSDGTGPRIQGPDLIAKQIALEMSAHLPDGGPSASAVTKFFSRIRGAQQEVNLVQGDMPGLKMKNITEASAFSEKAFEIRQEEARAKTPTSQIATAPPSEERNEQPWYEKTDVVKPKKQTHEDVHVIFEDPQEKAATRIQSAFRQKQAKQVLATKRQEKDQKLQEEATKAKEKRPAQTLDDLPTKPKSTPPELGSARDSREMAALSHANAVFAAAQQDHAAQQQVKDEEQRTEATQKLTETLSASFRTEVTAAKNTSWLSRTGEFHVERDRLVTIMAGKIATKIHDNPNIPTTYISGHAEEISRTTVETMRTQTMAGTADPEAHTPQDKTYKQLSEEFLQHRNKVADIEEVLTGPRATGRSFDDKLAEATSTAVASKAKETLRQQQHRSTSNSLTSM